MSAQLDWISPPAPASKASAPHRANGAAGPSWRERRDDGIRRAVAHAEADVPNWTEIAARYMANYAVRIANGQPFLTEDAREASIGRVPIPDEPRVWGAAGPYAARRGWLVRAGAAPARSSNGSLKRTWRAP